VRYQTFGRLTGLRISQYALGTAGFATGRTEPEEIFTAFVEAGGTTFDTSNIYQDGQAETVLGSLIGDRRDDLVIITKYTGTRRTDPRPATTGNARKIMIRSLEASLRRLNTDYVDVFMPHLPDGLTPTEEILAGFDDLIRAGKILHGALSNFPAWRIAGAAVRADALGLAPIIGLQTEYSLAERSAERELLPMAEAHGLGMLVYSPLAGGLLTGKYRRGEQGRLTAAGIPTEDGDRRTAVVDAVLSIADQLGAEPTQVALAWLRERAARSATALVPIIGPRTPSHLGTYLRSLDLHLDDEHYRRLDEVSAPHLGAPHEAVIGALRHGTDGDRSRLDLPPVPVA